MGYQSRHYRFWAAGIFEGEGCFFLNKVRKNGTEYTYAGAAVKMTDKDVVRRFAKVVGFGNVSFKKSIKRGHKDCWEWRCNGQELTGRLFNLFKEALLARRRCTGLWVLREGKRLKIPPKPPAKHGTRSKYRNGCRCKRCREVQNKRIREYRRSRPRKFQ